MEATTADTTRAAPSASVIHNSTPPLDLVATTSLSPMRPTPHNMVWQTTTEKRIRNRHRTDTYNTSITTNTRSSFKWSWYYAGCLSYGWIWGWPGIWPPHFRFGHSKHGLKTNTTNRQYIKHTVTVDSTDCETLRGLKAWTRSDDSSMPFTQVEGTVAVPHVQSNILRPELSAGEPLQMIPNPLTRLTFDQWKDQICSAVFNRFSKTDTIEGRALALLILSKDGHITCKILANEQGLSPTDQQSFDRCIVEAIVGLNENGKFLPPMEADSNKNTSMVFVMERLAGGPSGWSSTCFSQVDMKPFVEGGSQYPGIPPRVPNDQKIE